MNLAMPSCINYSGSYKEVQSTTTRILRAVHVPADIKNGRFSKTRTQSYLASKMCAQYARHYVLKQILGLRRCCVE